MFQSSIRGLAKVSTTGIQPISLLMESVRARLQRARERETERQRESKGVKGFFMHCVHLWRAAATLARISAFALARPPIGDARPYPALEALFGRSCLPSCVSVKRGKGIQSGKSVWTRVESARCDLCFAGSVDLADPYLLRRCSSVFPKPPLRT